MSTMATISLKNHAGTEQTFAPDFKTPTLVGWVQAGWSSLVSKVMATLGVKTPKDVVTGTVRITGKVTYPILDVTTGALKYTPFVTFEMVSPASVDLTNRRELWARFKDFVSDPAVQTVVEEQSTPL